jgi:phenylacetate-coenzyme A ligase PaaK-like adenylate-forming protein
MLAETFVRWRVAREHRRSAKLTRAELEAEKLAKFRRLVRYVEKRSPYYRRIVAERGIEIDTCTPSDFPVLTKSLLMRHFDEIATAPGVTKSAIAEFLTRSHDPAELFLDRYRVIHTSGSSGEVGYFVYSSSDWARGTTMRQQQRGRPVRKGGAKGKFRVAYYAAVDGHYAGVTLISAFKSGLARFFVDLEMFEVNDPLPDVLAKLNAFQPEVLIGYTTALKILAAEQRRGTLELERVINVTTAGEATTPADMTFLSETFGCHVVNSYGCSEHLGMGASAPGGDTIVLYDDDLVFELEHDHTLVTNLFNHTLPLIRYRMADVLRPIPSGEHAPYLVIESLVGRNELQPKFKNRDGVEDFISPHTINEIFVAGVTRFQLHLTGESEFRFMICLDPALDAAESSAATAAVAARLREILARKRMENVRFDVVPTDDLPVNPRTRKFQLILDRRGGEPAGTFPLGAVDKAG